MPQVFKIGSFLIYFWSNEGKPLEPVHVHISDGVPSPNTTKVWITKSGHTLLCNNNSNIPNKKLGIILKTISARSNEIITKWKDYFGEISYYC